MISHFYRPQGSCGKVMFSQVSVILFMRGGVVVWQTLPLDKHPPPPWQTPPHGQTPPWADPPTAADGTHPTGMPSC